MKKFIPVLAALAVTVTSCIKEMQVGEGAYRLYRGTWSLDEKTLTLDPSAEGEDQTYRKASIPSDVKENCVVVVKSGSEDCNPAL